MLDRSIPAQKEWAPQSCSGQGVHGAAAGKEQPQTWARNRVYVAKKNALLYNTAFFSRPSACLLPLLLFLYISLCSFIFFSPLHYWRNRPTKKRAAHTWLLEQTASKDQHLNSGHKEVITLLLCPFVIIWNAPWLVCKSYKKPSGHISLSLCCISLWLYVFIMFF